MVNQFDYLSKRNIFSPDAEALVDVLLRDRIMSRRSLILSLGRVATNRTSGSDPSTKSDLVI